MNNPDLTADRCALCAGQRVTPLYTVRDQRYVACADCGSGRLDPLPPHNPVELYHDGYFEGAENGGYSDYDADEAAHLRNAAARLDLLESVAGRGPHALIDIGCASGYVLSVASERGWAVAGVDASLAARQRAAARGFVAHDTIHAAAAALPQSPSAISMFQVLEHVRDPASLVADAAALLRERSGSLIVETWDLESRVARAFGRRWQQANPPSVLHLFTRRGVHELLAHNGLEVRFMAATSKRVSIGMVAGIAGGRWEPLNNVARRVTSSRLSGIGVPYRLGDLLTVVAVAR